MSDRRYCAICGKDITDEIGRWKYCGDPECYKQGAKLQRQRYEERRKAHLLEKRRARYEELLDEILDQADALSRDKLIDWLMTRVFLSR